MLNNDSRTRSEVGRVAEPRGVPMVRPLSVPATTLISSPVSRERLAVSEPYVMPPTIVCVDCGGVCHRLGWTSDEGDAAGDVVAYRCEDCLDRWDLEVPEDDLASQ